MNYELFLAVIDIGQRSDKILSALLHVDEIAAQRGGAVENEDDQRAVLFLRDGGRACRVEFGLLVPRTCAGLLPQLDIVQIRLRDSTAV